MDHTPGQRQFTDISKLRDYATGRRGMTEAEFQAHVARADRASAPRIGARHEAAAVAAARRLGATLASHDDTTAAQVAASAAPRRPHRRVPDHARGRRRLPRRTASR